MMQSNMSKTALAVTTAAAALAAYDRAAAANCPDAYTEAAHMLASVLRKPKAAKPVETDGLSVKRLKGALDVVCATINRRMTIPILQNVRLTAKGGALRLAATDLDAEAVVTLEGVQGPDFDITVGAHALRDMIRKGAGQVVLETPADDPRLKVTIGGAAAFLPILPVKDYPTMVVKARPPIQLNAAAFLDGLRAVQVAISTEETRYYLNGAYVHAPQIDGRQRLVFVATDGHRMIRHETDLPDGWGDTALLIPRAAVEHLIKFAPSTELHLEVGGDKPAGSSVSCTHVRLSAPGYTFTTKMIDGSFPDYNRVIPRYLADAKAKVVIHDAKACAASIAQVMTVSAEKSRSVRLAIAHDGIRATCRNMDAGTMTVDLAGVQVEAVRGIGPTVAAALAPFEISFNGQYLLDALKLGEQFAFSLWGANDPARLDLLNAGETLGILMPLRN